MLRTHTAGSLRAEHIGQTVTLAGWVDRRRDHGGVAFIDLRDASGIAQVVIRDEETARPLRSEFVLQVTGVISRRPAGNENPNLPSGEVEIVVQDVVVLNESAPLPFQVSSGLAEADPVGEDVRFKHRYLDLRRPTSVAPLQLRSKVYKALRDVLHEREFVEVETPTLTRSTPEGARDFVVPARLHPGSWYALPQSPQLFKQLLMVGGVEKYFQIARCYRDEDFRADRQPEFTQLDIEMAFVDQEDVIEMMEAVIRAMWATIGVEVQTPLPRMTYADAMAKYGSDKPDLRFGLELVEATDYFSETTFRVFQADYVGAVVMPGGASQPRKALDAWQDWAKQRGARGLAYVLFNEDGTLGGPVAKNLSESEQAGLAALVGAAPGDCAFFAAGSAKDSRALLGAARVEIGRRLGLLDPDVFAFTWVVDAPMFEPAADAVAVRRRRRRRRRLDRGAPRVHRPEARVRGHLRHGSRIRPRLRVRHRLQRLGARRRIHPHPPRGRAEARLRGHGDQRGAGGRAVRLPAGRVQVRRPAARRDRARHGPRAAAPEPDRLDPRGHRLPEDRQRLRPAHLGARSDHPGAAQGGRRRRGRGACRSGR